MQHRRGELAENLEVDGTERMSDHAREHVMGIMRREFMPRETLNLTFNHIEAKLQKIEKSLDSLPSDLAFEFERRFGDRIKSLERQHDNRLKILETQIEDLKAFRWKAAGILLAIQSALAFITEHWLKKP